ncbi:Peptidase domain protein OS=Pirellula staleyi (strain ATCC 27377 / DSM 6068 / ICPB 4128) GN=Psta_4129 PE=4 SV=1: PPC [Gemmataceae bacterium]|nr:Peptidase domain protein OS=Pirellula staleyi (strain ATCC 27377 / DSM 6068 / ICPB 4128) GN=Psta_4129 PE=4 SV=1: PPC [Gemmataceae bacterium]VTU01394.1 Peptidase domain protein OS=Pirellula staleyi (strain ATCC 27377 / DSM 6068 / ICPB 4128) GN=Psta_4129 PE=4 SV=1: PPC [Gemmataceae bacterium]
MSRFAIPCVLLLALVAAAAPQDKKPPEKKDPPKLLYAIPLVVKPGEKQKVAVRGKSLATATEVKVTGADGAKVKFVAARAAAPPNNYPAERLGDSEVELELELPKDAKPGEVKLVAVGPAGESAPYTLLLRDGTQVVAEKEPNDGFDQPQTLAVPCAVEASIKGERDVDVFKIEGKKGDTLRIEVQAARYGSPVDAVCVLYDSSRAVVASASESPGRPDPVLTATLPRDGAYLLSVQDANDLGGNQFGYRLVVTRPEK